MTETKATVTAVTPGPWEAEGPGDDERSDMVTVAVIGDWRVGPRTGIPGGDYRDTAFGTDEADAKFIAAACSACFALCDDPLRAAEAIPKIVEGLKQIAEGYENQDIGHKEFRVHAGCTARALLATLQPPTEREEDDGQTVSPTLRDGDSGNPQSEGATDFAMASTEALALIREVAPEMRNEHDRGDGHFSTKQVERAERLAVAPLPAPAPCCEVCHYPLYMHDDENPCPSPDQSPSAKVGELVERLGSTHENLTGDAYWEEIYSERREAKAALQRLSAEQELLNGMNDKLVDDAVERLIRIEHLEGALRKRHAPTPQGEIKELVDNLARTVCPECDKVCQEAAKEIMRLSTERDDYKQAREDSHGFYVQALTANKALANDLDEAQARIATALEQVELAITWPERQDEPFQDILYRIRAALQEQG